MKIYLTMDNLSIMYDLEYPTLKHAQNIVHDNSCTLQLHFLESQGLSLLQPDHFQNIVWDKFPTIW